MSEQQGEAFVRALLLDVLTFAEITAGLVARMAMRLDEIETRMLPAPPAPVDPAEVVPFRAAYRAIVRQALSASGGNRSEAARLLQIKRTRFSAIVRRIGLDAEFPPIAGQPGHRGVVAS